MHVTDYSIRKKRREIMQKKRLLKLEYYRKRYDINQEKMAGLLGVNQSTYSSKINGRAGISFDELLIIHKILNKEAKKAGDEYLSLDDIFLG